MRDVAKVEAVERSIKLIRRRSLILREAGFGNVLRKRYIFIKDDTRADLTGVRLSDIVL